ncbi:PIR protein [Plasmodium ovale]|uniref:PIR protein n=1 Tax=Plasmodium ovale TaxID=36330 RepID=A0A1D3JDS4_PLAOA|nr:PIR protein [Plasmodium ovale]
MNKVFNILLNSCTSDDVEDDGNTINVCNKYDIKGTDNYYVKELLQKFLHNIRNTYLTVNNLNNVYFKETLEDLKEYCIYFKYWLYDQILSIDYYESNISKIYEEWEKELKGEMYGNLSYQCTFNKLQLDDIKKLKSIYAFKLIFYNNIDIFNNEKYKPCIFLNTLGKGLNEYISSIDKCTKEDPPGNYCKEFNEFRKIYQDNIYWKNSATEIEYIELNDETENCALSIKQLETPLLLEYKNGTNILHISDKPIKFKSNSIITGISAMSSVTGISLLLLYLYRFTPLKSIFLNRAQTNNKKFNIIGEEMNDFTSGISKLEHTDMENGDYNISYYSLNNS